MNFALLFIPYSVLCSYLTCDTNYSFFCAKPVPRISDFENVCLQYLVACDGERDCLSQDDEVQCDLKNSTSKTEGESKSLLCSSPEVNYLWTPCESTPTICIPISSLCDGISDCDSGSDETSCNTECSSDLCDSSSTCQAIYNETEAICKCEEDKIQNLVKEFNPSAPLCIEKEEHVQYEIESFVYVKDKTFHEEAENGTKLYTSLFDDEYVRALTFDDNSSLFCFIRITTSDLMCFQKTPGGEHRWALMQFNNFQEFFNLNEIHRLSLHTNLQQIYFTGAQCWLCQLNFENPDDPPKCIFISDRSEVEVGLDPLRNLRFVIDHPLIGTLEHSRSILTHTFFDIAAVELDSLTKQRLFMLANIDDSSTEKIYAIHQITVSYEQRKIFIPYFTSEMDLHILVHDYNGKLLDDVDLSKFEQEEHGKFANLLQVLPDMSYVVSDDRNIYSIRIDENTKEPTVKPYSSLSFSPEMKIVIKRDDVTLPERCPDKVGAIALRSGDEKCKYICYSSGRAVNFDNDCDDAGKTHSDDLFFMVNVGNHHSSSISFYDFQDESFKMHAGLIDDSHPIDGNLVRLANKEVIALLSGHVRPNIMYRSLDAPSKVKTLTYLPVKAPSALALDPARQTVFFLADGKVYASSLHNLENLDADLNYVPITPSLGNHLGQAVSMAVDTEDGRVFLLYIKDLMARIGSASQQRYLAVFVYVDLKNGEWSPPQTKFIREIVPDIVICNNKLYSVEDRELCALPLGHDSAFVTFFSGKCVKIDNEDIFVQDRLMRLSCHDNKDLYLASNNVIYKLDSEGKTSTVRSVSSTRDLVIFNAVQAIDPAPRTCADAHVEYFNGEKTVCKCFIGYTMNQNNKCEKNSNPKASLVNFCSPGEFYCHNHKCINANLRCDGREHCGDYSDELYCQKNNCNQDEFKCHSGKCISKSAVEVRMPYDNYKGAVCDGVKDCPGGEDELEENCSSRPEITCAVEYLHHLCADKRQCINSWDICDGKNDCYDKSDELNCEKEEDSRKKCPDGFSKCEIINSSQDSRVLCVRDDEEDKNRACTMTADSDPAILVLKTPARIFTVFGKKYDVVETVPQGTTELSYAAYLKSMLVLVHETNLLNNSFPIVHIGPISLTWGKPEFSLKLVSENTKMKQFRFSEAFNTNYYRTSNPEAIWNEASEEISKNPSLIFMATENQKILQMQLVNCIDTIFALIAETKADKTTFFIIKLPGYDFTAQDGYKIELPEGITTGFAVNEQRICIVQEKVVQCQNYDEKKWRSLTEISGDAVIQASNGNNIVYLLERKDARKVYLTKYSGIIPESGGAKEIEFTGDLLAVDITVPHTTCDVDFCTVDKSKSVATSVIGPHNGGCEHICEFDKEKVEDGMGHKCKCQKGFALAKDTKTCFKHQLGDRSFNYPMSPVCPTSIRYSKTDEDDHVWLCPDMQKCINLESRCDGVEDCENGEDESFCDDWHQEGKYAVDETSENWHEAAHIHCPVGFYRCQNGQCIDESKIVFLDSNDDDSSRGCFDGSHVVKRSVVGDEYFCTMNNCDDQIADPVPSSRTPRKTADQRFSNCMPGEYKCESDGICIPSYKKCDGIPDCLGMDDEIDCQGCNGVFSCYASNVNDMKCVPNEKICDGEKDCLNGQDEVNCDDARPNMDCSAGEYLNLATGLCTKTDDEHCSVGHLPCSQKCVPTVLQIQSPICKCVDDYTPDQNGICRVDHEFASETYKPQIMFGNQKNFARINFENKTAELLSTKQSNVVAFDYNYELSEFYWASVDGSVKGTTHIRAIKTDSIHDISKIKDNFFNENVKSYGLREQAQIDSLSVDWITGNIYFGDKINGKLFVMTGKIDDQRFTKTLMDKNTPVVGDKLKHIRAIAIYQPKGLLFYSDWGTHAHIGRVNMDGTDAKILLDNTMQGAPPVAWPNHIVIDITSSSEDFGGSWSPSPMIYFVDARHDYVARTNFDFTEFQYVFKPVQDDSTHIFSIALFEEYIYLSEWKSNKKNIFRIHKNCDASAGCVPEEVLSKSLDQKPMSIAVIDQALQPPLGSANPCENKCDEKELCLLTPGTDMSPNAVCVCGDGYSKNTEGKCVDDCKSFTEMNADTGNCEEVWKQSTEEGNACGAGFFTCGGLSNDDLAEAKRTRDPKFCIAPIAICDGNQDCADGSDEKECANFDCSVLPGVRRKCAPSGTGNEQCVEQSKFCDGENDCPSGEDETHSSCKCPSGMYQCKTIQRRFGYRPQRTECLPKEALCDGNAHCLRRDDEYKCPPPYCRKDQFYCVRSLKCISNSQRCDGIVNCGYGEDETGCKQLSCDVPDAFECHKSGKNICARQSWVCDGRNDCPNNEDEDDQLCGDPSYSHPCETGLYCNNRCVYSHEICDGENFCPDGADESNCGCSSEEFFCDANAGPQCIDRMKVCDGRNDCHIDPVYQIAADERFCDHDNECKGYLCKASDGSAQCIGDQTTSNLECDGNADCQDGSDEANCNKSANLTSCYDATLTVRDDVFRCASGGCIAAALLCDGKDDCSDGSDETDYCRVEGPVCDRNKNACAQTLNRYSLIGLCATENPCQQSCNWLYSDINGEHAVQCGCHSGYDTILQYSENSEPIEPARLCRGKNGDDGFELLLFSESEMNMIMVNPEREENHLAKQVHEVFNEVAYFGGVLSFKLPEDVVPLRHATTDLKRKNTILIGKKMKISRGRWDLPEKTDDDRREEIANLIKEYYNNPLFWADVDVSERSHILTHTTLLTYLQNVDVLSVSTFKDGVHEFETIDTQTGYIKFSSNSLSKIAPSLRVTHVLIQDRGLNENRNLCQNEIVVLEDKFGQALFYQNNVPFITRKSFMNSRQGSQALTNVSSLVDDSYSCKIYWASGTTIWQATTDIIDAVTPTQLVSLKFWTYKYAGKHTSMTYYHDDIENPVIKMTMFENLLYVALSDKSGQSAVRLLTVHTRTGKVRPLKTLSHSKIIGISLAPWASLDGRIAGQFKEEPLEDVESICEQGVICSNQYSSAPMTLSCAGNEEEWTPGICDDLIANEEAPEIHKGMSWASISIAIIIVISGIGLVYLKKLRENRYKQLPTQNMPGGDTVTTTFNENGVWSAGEDSRPIENHNPLFHEFNNKGEPKSSTERAGLIENEVTDPDRD